MSQNTTYARVLFSIKPELRDLVDEKAGETGKNRSEFIRDAIRFYLQNGDHFNLLKKETDKNEFSEFESGNFTRKLANRQAFD